MLDRKRKRHWVTFWYKEKFYTFRGSIYPFKTTDLHPDDLERQLTPEPSKTASKTEDISDVSQYNALWRLR